MYYFIINPASSSGRSLKVWERVEAILREEEVSYESFILSQTGEAELLATRISTMNTPCTIVALGGDGTINEVINGIRNFSEVTFACIPSGSGNDFIRGMRLTTSPEEMIRAILHPTKQREINIGKVSATDKSRCFVVSAGMGFDAEVCYGVMQTRMKPLLNRIHAGSFVYTAVALKQLFTMKRQPLRIVADGKRLIACEKGYFTAVMNLPYEGGGFKFCPQARAGDDLLDLCIVDKLSRLAVVACLPLAYFGRHTAFPGIQIVRCSKVTIQNETPVCVHVDGEHFGYYKKITVQPLVHKLKVITG
jgi:YegS/Rv2252/BmrU family lipid kinase